VLLPHKTDESIWWCPQCGSQFNISETLKEQNLQSEHPATSETKIVQARKKRKYYDSFANLIPEDDKDAMADLASGKRIVYYHEEKAEENKDKVASIGKHGKVSWSDLM
jgi:DNA-directed RNA polymerase subunit M/transcription elongation factor TFIIS